MTLQTADIVDRLSELSPEDRTTFIADAMAAVSSLRWKPQPGPQTEAFFSPADVLLYGGSAGSGKSSLIIGLSLTAHQNSLICRRQYTDLGALTEEALRFNGTRNGFSGSPPPKLRTPDGRLITFFAAAMPGDEQHRQGQPVDLLAVDEAAQWHKSQITFLMGWVRSTTVGQRTRIVFASNPPLTSEGQWMTEMFAPWLDPAYPNPAKPGELRYFVTDAEGVDREVGGPDRVEVGDRMVQPLSRTFIPGALKDNIYLSRTDYANRLDALPEPLRSAVRDGNFNISREDDPAQLIPFAWIEQAQARWQPFPPPGVPMCAMGVDIAAGGADHTVLAPRYDGYFPELVEVPGRNTPTGSDAAALVIQHRRDGADVIVDMQGGYGAACFERLKDNGITPFSFKGAEKAMGRSRDGKLKFTNKRTEAYWRVREALDPDQPGGSPIALPRDAKLAGQLAAVHYEVGANGIQAEPKESVVKRLGHSPDRADAVIMSWYRGITGAYARAQYGIGGDGQVTPQVLHGHENRKRR